MRVISGSAKGIKLNVPENNEIRPSLDRYKEDIFNIINLNIFDKNFLDLFAGTGSIGIEALSRGARQCTFVDNSTKSINIIKSNLKKTKFIENTSLLQYDYKRAISSLDGELFDFIYLDPPFNQNLELAALNELSKSKLLSSDGMIICESSLAVDFSKINGFGLEVFREKKYRYCKFTFLKGA